MSEQTPNTKLTSEISGDYFVSCRITTMFVGLKLKYGSVNINAFLKAILEHPVLGDPNELMGNQYRRYFRMDAPIDLISKLDRSFNEAIEKYNHEDTAVVTFQKECEIICMYWVGAIGWELGNPNIRFHAFAFSQINRILREKLQEIQSVNGDITNLKNYFVIGTVAKFLPNGEPGEKISLLNSAWSSLMDEELAKYYTEWYTPPPPDQPITNPVVVPNLLH